MSLDPKKFEDDDGRVIASMDVEGMPWHDKRARSERKKAERTEARAGSQGEPLTPSEARRYTWHAVLAGLLVVGIFSAVWVLFILFCIFIWFR